MPTTAERPPEALVATQQALDRLIAAASPPWWFVGEEKNAAELERQVAALTTVRANLDQSLVILLLGGTGVGKSSLLNALAGESIARTSPVRPCTTAATFYASRLKDIEELKVIVEAHDFKVEGAGPGLNGKIVVDPPDFDSTNDDNRARLLRLLDVADLVLVVANRIKYRQATLFDLLKRFRQAKSFAFVMNMRDDPLWSESVLEDWRATLAEHGFASPKLFAVSALQAFEAKLGGLVPDEDDAGDFARLEGFIGEELHAQRLADIRRQNVRGVVEGLATVWSACAPEPDALDAAVESEELERLARWLAKAWSRQARIALFEGGPDLERFLRQRALRGLDGTLGLLSVIVNRLRGTSGWRAERAARPGPGLAGMQSLIRKRLDDVSRKVWKTSADQARREAIAWGQGQGIAPSRLDDALAGLSAKDLADRQLDDLSTHAEDMLERLAGQDKSAEAAAPWWLSLVSPYNALPNVLLGLGLIHFIVGLVQGQARFGILGAGVISATIVGLLLLTYLQRRAEDRAEAARRRLMERLEEELEDDVDAALVAPLQELMAEAADRVRMIRGTWTDGLPSDENEPAGLPAPVRLALPAPSSVSSVAQEGSRDTAAT